MRSRRHTSAALLAAAVTAVAPAAPPQSINTLTGLSRLSLRQQNQIAEYAQFWCGQLGASPKETATARRRLIDPLRAIDVSGVFRFEYAGAALERLERVIDGDDLHAAYNAIQVVGFFGTKGAIDVLVGHCDSAAEPRMSLRLASAICFKVALRQGDVADRQIARALRDLGRAARREEHWLVLRRQFEAIAAVPGPVSREVQVNVLTSVTERMVANADGPSDLMRAARPALKLMLDNFIRLPARDQTSFGTALAPVLCEVCTVAQTHWGSAQADQQARKDYGGAIHLSENLLKLIHGQVQPNDPTPRTNLGGHWRKDDEPRFNQDHDTWQGILRRPPYRQ